MLLFVLAYLGDVLTIASPCILPVLHVQSPETSLGYRRSEKFVSSGGIANDVARVYAADMPRLNEWSLSGDWTIGGERADLNTKDGDIVYRFHARDVHLVLGPAPGGEPIRFHVTIDGKPPGDNHGADLDAAGDGTVTEQRLYQLVRQNGTIIATGRSKSGFSIQACRLTLSPSAETGTPPCLSLFQPSRPGMGSAPWARQS